MPLRVLDNLAAVCEHAFVRTTLDVPDGLFEQAQLRALPEGVSLKSIVSRALEAGLASVHLAADSRKARAHRLFTALDKARNAKPVGRLKREGLYDRSVLRGH